MGDVHPLRPYKVVRLPLDEGVPALELGYDNKRRLLIGVAESLPDDKVDEAVKMVLDRHRRSRLFLLPLPIAWLQHGARTAGQNAGTTLTVGAVGLAAGAAAVAAIVYVSPPAARHPGPVAAGPGLSEDREKPPHTLPLANAPRARFTGPSAPRKAPSGTGGTPATSGPPAVSLAAAGVPAQYRPPQPVRRPVVPSVHHVPPPVPVPQPVQCVLKVVLSVGHLITVTICLR